MSPFLIIFAELVGKEVTGLLRSTLTEVTGIESTATFVRCFHIVRTLPLLESRILARKGRSLRGRHCCRHILGLALVIKGNIVAVRGDIFVGFGGCFSIPAAHIIHAERRKDAQLRKLRCRTWRAHPPGARQGNAGTAVLRSDGL